MTHQLVTTERHSCGDSTGTFSFCLPFPLPLTIRRGEGRALSLGEGLTVLPWQLEGKGCSRWAGAKGRQK